MDPRDVLGGTKHLPFIIPPHRFTQMVQQHITSTNNNKKLSALQGAQRALFWFSYPCNVSMFVQQGALLCHCWSVLSVVFEPTLQLHKQKL